MLAQPKRLALERLDVRSVRSLGTDRSLVGHLRTLRERLEAAAYDRRVMNEQVLTLIVGGDEPVALLIAEPFDGSGCHVIFPPGTLRAAKRGRCTMATTTDAGTDLPRGNARYVFKYRGRVRGRA